MALIKKLIVLGCCFLWILFSPVFSQADLRALESRLSGANGEERLRLLVELTKRYRTNDLGKAYAYGVKALEVMRRMPEPAELAMVVNLLGSITYRQGKYRDSINYSNQAKEIAQKSGNNHEYAEALYNLGMGNKYLANYDSSLQYFSEARGIYEKIGDLEGIAGCLNQTGLVYRRLNQFSKALEFILQAGKTYDKLENKSNLSIIYNNIGIIYDEMGNPGLALDYYKKALEIDEERKDFENVAIDRMNIASIFDLQGKYDEALELYKKSLAVFEQLGSQKNIGNVLISMGDNYEKRQDLQRALRYYTRAKKIKEDIREYYGIVEALLKLGGIHRRLGQYPPALQYLTEALALSQKIKNPGGIRDAYFELATLNRDLENYQKALEYYIKYKETNDLVFNETNSRRIAQLQSQFDLERKEKELTLLKKDHQIRTMELEHQRNLTTYFIVISILILILAFVIYTRYRLKARVNLQLIRYRESLSEQVEERTRELKEAQGELVLRERLSVLGQLTATVAHEIRNPLCIARNSIFSIEKDLENSNIDRVHQALQLAERNIVRCDYIITDLLDFTRQRELRPEPTDIDSWLENLLKERTFPKEITCIQNLKSHSEIPVDHERLLRAVTNVLDNAVDALQEKGAQGKPLTLTISTRVVDQRLEIGVTDTGPGIPAANLDKIFEPLFSTKRFGFGLGLAVVKNIMAGHGGGVEIRSQTGEGTTVILYMPVTTTGSG